MAIIKKSELESKLTQEQLQEAENFEVAINKQLALQWMPGKKVYITIHPVSEWALKEILKRLRDAGYTTTVVHDQREGNYMEIG